jgi:nicotinamide-nucleotide amidase
VGTAPAFIIEHHGKTVITLPGVPREMEHLLMTRAIPYLRERYGIKGEIRLRVLKVVGLGDVRIEAKGLDREDAQRLIAPVEAEIRARLGEAVFGTDDDTLES